MHQAKGSWTKKIHVVTILMTYTLVIVSSLLLLLLLLLLVAVVVTIDVIAPS
jgi:hypothetical protein